jgi:four helix bundle protein
MAKGVKRHTELRVWQQAHEIRGVVWEMTRKAEFGHYDNLWLRLQLRKAANSACANIAEGFGRYHPREFARFLLMAKSSLEEIGDHLHDPTCVALVPAAERNSLQLLTVRAVRAATRLINYLRRAPPPEP